MHNCNILCSFAEQKGMRILILDFDGTIADTSRAIIAAVGHTLRHFGLLMPDEQEIRNLIGLPLHDTFSKAARIADENLISDCIKEYRVYFNRNSNDLISLYPYVRETLEELHEDGIVITLASSRGKCSLVHLLDKLGISHLFSMVVGEEDVEKTKPFPDAVNLILSKFNISSEEALVVGDTVFDLEMGNKAYTFTCGVTYGNHSAAKLSASEPTYLINRFDGLKQIMKVIQ